MSALFYTLCASFASFAGYALLLTDLLQMGQVLNILAMLMLRLRDGKTRGMKQNGVLLQMAKELIAAAKEEGGYPDSDDEDEEEGSSGPTPHMKKPPKAMRGMADSLISVDQQSISGHGIVPDYRDSSMYTGQQVNTTNAIPRKGRKRMAVLTK